jgi:sugar lactone lactonase YvrE
MLAFCFVATAKGHSQTLTYGWTIIAGPTYGFADGTNNDAEFYNPSGIARDSAGNLYIGDTSNSSIRKIAHIGSDWVTTTLAGNHSAVGLKDGTNAGATFFWPQGVAVDSGGTIYVTDTGNNAIRKVTPIGTNWVVTTIAGTGGGVGRDGTNARSSFNQPNAIAIDASTNLYIADSGNSTIRKITPVGTNWVTTTVAGLAGNTGFADGTNSSARFNYPNGIAVDSQGNLFVAEFWNHTFRQISPVGTNWVVSTIAGLPGVNGARDGTNGDARFSSPMGVTVDGAGNLYVSDYSSIRRITHEGTNWIVTSLRSTNSPMYFNQANSLVFDRLAGDLYYVSYGASYVGRGQPAFSLQSTVSGSQLTLTWPLGASNYLLETTSTPVDPTSWTQVGSNTGPVNGSYAVTVDMDVTGPAAFYRLHSP